MKGKGMGKEEKGGEEEGEGLVRLGGMLLSGADG